MDQIKIFFEEKVAKGEFKCIVDNAYASRKRQEYVKKEIGDIKGKKVLDLGCGLGHYSVMMLSKGADVTSFDLSFNMLKRLPKECKKRVQGTVVNLPFKKNSFDMVICIEVLQYLRKNEVSRAFKEIHRIMKPKAKLVLTTISGDWKEIFFLGWLRKKLKKSPPFYQYFGKKDIRQFLKETGFSKFKIVYFTVPPSRLLKPISDILTLLIPAFAFNIKATAEK